MERIALAADPLVLYKSVMELKLQWLYGLTKVQVELDMTDEAPPCKVAVNVWVPAAHARRLSAGGGSAGATAPTVKAGNGRPSLLLLQGGGLRFGLGAAFHFEQLIPDLQDRFDLVIPEYLDMKSPAAGSPAAAQGALTGGENSGRGDKAGDNTAPVPTPPPPQDKRMANRLDRMMKVLGMTSPYDIVGYSAGGAIAYRMALDHGHAVRRVVMLAAGVVYSPGDSKRILDGMGLSSATGMTATTEAELKHYMENVALYGKPWWLTPYVLHSMFKTLPADPSIVKAMQAGAEALFKGMEMKTADVVQRVTDKKILFLIGEYDPFFPGDRAAKQAEFLSPNAELKLIPKTRHMPQVEQPQQVSTALLDFFL